MVSQAMRNDRVTVTIHLYRGRDDDLIQWANTLSNRNEAAKGLLRAALLDGIPPAAQPTIQSTSSPLVDDLLNENKALKQKIAQIDKDLHYLNEQIENLKQVSTLIAAPPDNTDFEPSDRLTAKEKAVRKGKLLRNTW